MLIGLQALDMVPKKAAGTAAGFTGFFGYVFGSAICRHRRRLDRRSLGLERRHHCTCCVCAVLTMAFSALTLAIVRKVRHLTSRHDQDPSFSFPSRCSALANAQPIVIAHRGASGYLPEHTLEAKAMAHAMGADFIEQDIVLTKDDVPVVMHDIYLDTISDVAARFPGRHRANGRYYALDFTLAEIKQLQATERFSEKTGRQVYPKRFPKGASSFQIPTLEEELQFIGA